jgi:non-reducing end alpha-L-arabinofuranosidase
LRSTRQVARPRLIPILAVSLGLTLLACSTSGPVTDGGSGGETGSGGRVGTGGATGGVHGSGGATGGTGSGGQIGQGGSSGTGGSGSTGTGGGVGSGGTSGAGGAAGQGAAGSKGTGGATATGGSHAGGAGGNGGVGAIGGKGGAGGVAGTGTGGAGGATAAATGPCDIYEAGNTPCVAAHSTVRALYGNYGGPLYQVRRASDKGTKDITVLGPGSYANSSVQDSFCAGTSCTISVLYDQSPNANHLTKAPPGGWLTNGGLEANATAARITANGHMVYGLYTTSNFDDAVGAVGYRNNSTKGVPTGDNPEAMYMVASGKHYNQWCCFDYGNAETNNIDDGKATMEAVYFGNSTQWGRGSGSGPWVMADLEDGVYAGGSTAAPATNTSLVANYVTVMLKGPSGNRFVLKGADAGSGNLATKYDGARPAGYSPQKKQGAIILGIGGDNSHTGEGTFFEGCMTAGVPADSVDDAVEANIVAAGYGR